MLASLGVAGEPATLALPATARAVVLLVDGLGAELLRPQGQVERSEYRDGVGSVAGVAQRQCPLAMGAVGGGHDGEADLGQVVEQRLQPGLVGRVDRAA